MPTNRERLRKLIEERCLSAGPEFTLSTGEKSNFYFDCKGVTLHGEGLALIAREFLDEVRQFPIQPTAIGGLTMGADFIAAAVIVLAHQNGSQLQDGSIVRKEPKKHGTRNRIENQLPPGTKIVVIDDVVTSGSATLKACDELEAAGYDVVVILAVVDREAGGIEKLAQRYPRVRTLFRKSDFPALAAVSASSDVTRETAG